MSVQRDWAHGLYAVSRRRLDVAAGMMHNGPALNCLWSGAEKLGKHSIGWPRSASAVRGLPFDGLWAFALEQNRCVFTQICCRCLQQSRNVKAYDRMPWYKCAWFMCVCVSEREAIWADKRKSGYIPQHFGLSSSPLQCRQFRFNALKLLKYSMFAYIGSAGCAKHKLCILHIMLIWTFHGICERKSRSRWHGCRCELMRFAQWVIIQLIIFSCF